MSVEQLKKELVSLSAGEQAEVAAFLFHLRLSSDPDYQRTLQRRMDDKDGSHWLTVAEFERRLDQD